MNQEQSAKKTMSYNPPMRVSYAERIGCQGHPGMVIWFTGLSGAGKTTLATMLERRLFEQGRRTYLLDGDILRTGLCRDLGFSAAERQENVRRAGEVARLLADGGLITLVAFISPFREDRDRVRHSMGKMGFAEVYVNAPLEVCERRDVKGLYRRARAREIPEFTGISSPYEHPLTPEVELRTDLETTEQCLDRLIAHINKHIAAQT